MQKKILVLGIITFLSTFLVGILIENLFKDINIYVVVTLMSLTAVVTVILAYPLLNKK